MGSKNNEDGEDLKRLVLALEEQIERAKKYINSSVVLEEKKVDGASKLTKRIKAELKFLNELKEGTTQLKACHLNSTNLSNLGAILNVAENDNLHIVALLKTITWSKHGELGSSTITVDVVTSQSWLKVTARNPIALHKSWQGEGNFGEKSIEEQAKEYIEASEQHKLHYIAPKVIFVFTQGITENLAECLLGLGISVKGDIIPDPCSPCLRNPEIYLDKELEMEALTFKCSKVNLDVTAMIALVSALTNGSCYYTFVEQVLSDQAESERKHPLLPHLNEFLEGKDLYACSWAISSFQKILDTLGGVNEKERARKLLSKVKEVSDCPSERSQNLKASTTIKPRPKVIFGTGDMLQAVTVSSNGSFIRAAKEQGVEFSVFLHEPRALTESKEPFATIIKEEMG